MNIKIYHNPRCSKSRQTLELLQKHGENPEIIEYLKEPATEQQITALLKTMKITDPREIMRKGEPIYKELDLGNEANNKKMLIKAIAQNPILIERPIVITKKGARICRPPELVKDLL